MFVLTTSLAETIFRHITADGRIWTFTSPAGETALAARLPM